MNGIYQVSNMGNVRNIIKGKTMKLYKNRYGYMNCCLCKNGKKSLFTAHRLVAKAFINNPNNYEDINHIDGNKENNCVDNLEWCNRSHNIKEAFRIGLMKSNYTHSLYSKGGLLNPRCRKVNQYDLNGNFIKQWGSIKSINLETGYSRAYIWGCCNGRHKKAYNFIWKYAD